LKYLPIIILLVSLLPPLGTASAGESLHSPLHLVYHLPLRVHLAGSGRPEAEFEAVFEEINEIWFKQAGICFEIEAVRNDQESEKGLNMWFRPEIGGWNGSYDGELILMKDHPVLAPARHPARESAARTAAHELGHALGLLHDQSDSDNLMASKTFGWQLHQGEIEEARRTAARLGRPDSEGKGCGPARFISKP